MHQYQSVPFNSHAYITNSTYAVIRIRRWEYLYLSIYQSPDISKPKSMWKNMLIRSIIISQLAMLYLISTNMTPFYYQFKPIRILKYMLMNRLATTLQHLKRIKGLDSFQSIRFPLLFWNIKKLGQSAYSFPFKNRIFSNLNLAASQLLPLLLCFCMHDAIIETEPYA